MAGDQPKASVPDAPVSPELLIYLSIIVWDLWCLLLFCFLFPPHSLHILSINLILNQCYEGRKDVAYCQAVFQTQAIWLQSPCTWWLFHIIRPCPLTLEQFCLEKLHGILWRMLVKKDLCCSFSILETLKDYSYLIWRPIRIYCHLSSLEPGLYREI